MPSSKGDTAKEAGRASEWNVNPEAVGVMGFSMGLFVDFALLQRDLNMHAREGTTEFDPKTLEALRNDLAKVRTGRAHTGLLDHVMVDYYGTPTAVPQRA